MRTLTTLFSLVVATLPVLAQVERCGDHADNDGDYLTDCADPDCDDCSARFPCTVPANLYQIAQEPGATHQKLRRYDVGTNTWTPIYSFTNMEVNAIGYNNHDGYIYGINRLTDATYGTHSLVRVTNSTTTRVVEVANVSLPAPTAASPADYYYVGSCDINGNLFVMSGAETNMYRIDLDVPGTPAVQIALSPATAPRISDFAYSVPAGSFFGLSGSGTYAGQLVEITTTGTVTTHTVTGLPTGSPGAVFCDNAGVLYFYFNTSGTTYSLTPTDGTFNSWVTDTLNTSDTLSYNDGASCPLGGCICCADEARMAPQLRPAPTPRAPLAPEPAKESGALQQNRPNPFDRSTTVDYAIDAPNAGSASIRIYDLNGVPVWQHAVAIAAQGQITIDAGALKPGMYRYTLVVDGKEMDTKRMVVLGH